MRRLPRINAPPDKEYIWMEKSTSRPRAKAEPVDLDQSMELLEELLRIEKKRLSVAVRIEEERNIVFPETTIIRNRH